MVESFLNSIPRDVAEALMQLFATFTILYLVAGGLVGLGIAAYKPRRDRAGDYQPLSLADLDPISRTQLIDGPTGRPVAELRAMRERAWIVDMAGHLGTERDTTTDLALQHITLRINHVTSAELEATSDVEPSTVVAFQALAHSATADGDRTTLSAQNAVTALESNAAVQRGVEEKEAEFRQRGWKETQWIWPRRWSAGPALAWCAAHFYWAVMMAIAYLNAEIMEGRSAGISGWLLYFVTPAVGLLMRSAKKHDTVLTPRAEQALQEWQAS